MTMKIAARMDKLPPSGIRKVNEKALSMERAGETVYHFEIGRPDFDTPEYIKKAAVDSLARGEVFYTSNFGTMELRQAIVDKLREQNGVDYQTSEILVSVGLSEGIFDIFCTILDEGDEILVPDPAWLNYHNVPRMLGAVPVTYTLREENGYQLDLEELRSKVTDKTRAVVIITPNNPTGSVLSRDILQGLADLAIEKDLLVLADEVYERLIYDNTKHVSIASLPGMRERTIVLNGFSKAFAMTGWRMGYICAPRELCDVMCKIHQYTILCAPRQGQVAAEQALRRGREDNYADVRHMRDSYDQRRRLMVTSFRKMGLSCFEPLGAFYVFPGIRSTGLSSDEFCERLLKEYQVVCVPGTAFGQSGEGHIRCSYATSLAKLQEALDRMEKFVSTL